MQGKTRIYTFKTNVTQRHKHWSKCGRSFLRAKRGRFYFQIIYRAKGGKRNLYWLELLHESEYLQQNEFDSIFRDAEELMKLLTSSIKTMKHKLNN